VILKEFLNQGRLVRHKTSSQEISDLLNLVERDLKDALIKEISADRRFSITYNAVLQLAILILYCNGYKPKGSGHHFVTLQSIKEILGKEYYSLIEYFDSCRVKRNILDYDRAGEISENEVEELIEEAMKFKEMVKEWVKRNFPNFF